MMKKTLFTFFLMASGLSWSQTISTDAPSMTPSAEVVQPRVFQYEGRIQYTNSSYLDLPLNLFRIGLSKRWEFRTVNGLGIAYSSFNNKWSGLGIGGIQLGTKFALMDDKESRMKMAVLAHYKLPNPKQFDYSSQSQTADITLAVSHSLNERSSISYSLGLNFSVLYHKQYGVLNEHYITTGTFAYTNVISEKLNVFCEVYGNYSSIYYMSNEIINGFLLSSDAGIYYQLRGNMQVDYTFGYGINESMRFHSLGFDIMIAPKKD